MEELNSQFTLLAFELKTKQEELLVILKENEDEFLRLQNEKLKSLRDLMKIHLIVTTRFTQLEEEKQSRQLGKIRVADVIIEFHHSI